MKKIVLFTQNLDIGGVQKSVSTLANFLTKFYRVFIVLSEDNKEIRYKLHSSIEVRMIKTKKFDLAKKTTALKIFNYRVKELDKILNIIKPSLVFSYEDYNNFISLKTKYKTQKIVSVRVSIDNYRNKRIHLFDESYYLKNCKKYYKNEKVLVVSKAIQKHIPHAKVIYNGIRNLKALDNPFQNYILNVGRLHEQKGQVDLIQAFNCIKDKTEHNLIIVGDGKLREKLELLIAQLKLQKRVLLVGFDNPYKYYKNASFFVFPSYYEGFPNALIEAMKSNLAVLSYDFPGSEEILQKRIELGNIQELAHHMLYLLENEKEREKIVLNNEQFISSLTLSKTLKNYKFQIDKMMVSSTKK